MENRKHKSRLILILVFVIVGLAGGIYFYYRSKTNEIQPIKTFRWLGTDWFNEQGMFQFEDNYLNFYNPQTGNKVIACSRAGCDHSKKNCPATYMSYGVTYTNNGMIFCGKPQEMEFDEIGLYTIDGEGKNLKQLHMFHGVSVITDVLYEDSKVYISYCNTINKEGNDLEQPEVGIIEYDMKTGDERTLFKEMQCNPQVMTMNRNTSGLFFIYIYSTMSAEEALQHADDQEYASQHQRSELRYISLKDKSTACLTDELDSYSFITVLNEKAVVCKEDGVYLYSAKGTSEKLLSDTWETVPIYRDGKEELLLRKIEKRTEKEKVEYAYYKTEKSKKKTLYSKYVSLAVMGKYAWFMNSDGVMCYANGADFIEGKDIEEKTFKEKK